MAASEPPVSASPLFCLGHSHLRCVQAASVETGIAIDARNFWDDNSDVVGFPAKPEFAPALQQRIRGYPGPVFSFIGGGGPIAISLLAHPRRFDVVLPQAPSLPLDPAAEILPVDAVRTILRRKIQPFLDLLLHVRSLAPHRLVHMESPPPCADAQPALAHIPWALFPGMTQEISRRHLRYKIWRLHSDLVAGVCAEHGVDYLAHPPQAVDDEGFLRAEFSIDGIHANASYGALQLRQMQEVR
jgi:hypothetical protein